MIPLAALVTLHLAVPAPAGTTAEVVVSGASGPCAATATTLTCPADGPVTFTWPDAAWSLWGDTTLEPESEGRAWLLAAPGSREAVRTAVYEAATRPVERRDLLVLHRNLVGFSGEPAPWPDVELLLDTQDLLAHPDPRVRREAVDALGRWVRATPPYPLPLDAPVPLDAHMLTALSRDPSPRVRRHTLRLLRPARDDIPRDVVATIQAERLADPVPGVRATAVRALPDMVRQGAVPALDAWNDALSRVPRPLPEGRAACNQLARLQPDVVDLGVDPTPAMQACLTHHPERAWHLWTAWRHELPVRVDWIRRLLDDTLGLNPTLILRWADVDRQMLDHVVDSWVPAVPERRQAVLDLLAAHDAVPPR